MKDFDRKYTTINLVSNINELIIQTEVTQYFKNTKKSPIELQMVIPKLSNSNLTKFEMTMGNQKIISKLFEKSRAKEKYTDTISSGNSGLISYSSREETTICLGNIPPQEEVELKTYFFGHIISKDYSYQATFPVIFPGFILDDPKSPFYKEPEEYKIEKQIVKGKININTFSKLTRLVIKGSNNFGKIEKKFGDDGKSVEIDIYKYNFSDKDIPGIILFRTEEINKDKIFLQYDKDKEKYYYILQKTLKTPKFKLDLKDSIDQEEYINYDSLLETNENEENNNKICYIFLLDQSGSMEGKPIELCKRALLLLLQSLNKGCYFQLIGFGSKYEYYSETPLEYNKENINNLMNIIRKLSADKEGTELFKPLNSIYNNNNLYEKYDMVKHIIVLTDGIIEHKTETINLIGSHSDKFYFHSIGIGQCDKDLIEKTALIGNGYSYYIENIKNISKVIISIIEQTQTQILIECEYDKLEDNNNYIEDKKKNFIKIYDYFRHGIILDKYIDNIIFKIKNDKDKNEMLLKDLEIKEIPNGDELGKLIADDYLNENKSIKYFTKIKLSKDYNILCSETAFYAEIQNEIPTKEKMITITNDKKEAVNNNNETTINNTKIENELDSNNNNGLETSNNFVDLKNNDEINDIKNKEKKKGFFSFIYSLCSCKNKKNKIIKKKIYKKIEGEEDIIPESSSSSKKNKNKENYPKIILPKKKRKNSDDDSDSDDDSKEKKSKKRSFSKRKKCRVIEDDDDEVDDPKFDEIILGQDILEGNWKRDNNNEILIESEKELYEKIQKYFENKLINNEDAIITVFILCYLFKEKKEKIEELKFIIKKAKNYINKKFNLEFDNIVKELDIKF